MKLSNRFLNNWRHTAHYEEIRERHAQEIERSLISWHRSSHVAEPRLQAKAGAGLPVRMGKRKGRQRDTGHAVRKRRVR
jgi:hypothetical protein